ncbi:MAG TPA: hypothetical protein VJM50_21215 [Pyrinomonadaceae bacterium]|nr:hypothetical protein [Pyrinomonadaceae bacterium]
MTAEVSEKEKVFRRKLRSEFEFYAPRCLKIITKKDEMGRSEIRPFEFNAAQKILHDQAERMKAETGYVRIIVLKGRQQGCSTYVEGRFYWKTTMNGGEKTFILTHQEQATDNLFNMAKRYHDNAPAQVQPYVGKSNSKEMIFPRLNSSYQVATAGAKGAGRSATLANVHGSEVGFWENGSEHLAGLMQAVPLAPGTEVFLESTANGFGNTFHKQWEMAVKGQSDFRAVFIPWFIQTEYRRKPPADFENHGDPEGVPEGELTEVEYAEAFGLDTAQMFWRRMKIAEMGGDDEAFFLFKQEYPATPDEAFQKSSMNSLLSRKHVIKARKSTVATAGQLIIGVDAAGDGENSDRTAIVRRRTRRIFGIETFNKLNTMQIAARIHNIIKQEKPARVFIDVGGLGVGIVDRLMELEGTAGIVVPVNFGETANNPETYVNRKAEMAWEFKEWLEDPGGANIPDDNEVQGDLLATPPDDPDSNQRKRLKPKKWVKKHYGKSPDIFDACCLTFAMPLASGGMTQGNAMSDFDPFDLSTGSEMIGNNGWDQFDL